MTPLNAKKYYGSADQFSLLLSERVQLAKSRQSSSSDWNGIALSGGGIRSATFCLGALQALADKNLIGKFDYISSVSGGGYTAAALQWWWWQKDSPFGASKDTFPYPTTLSASSDKSGPQNQVLDFLRRHGRYLAPGDGLTIWSIISVVLRTLCINLGVWLPLVALVFAVLIGLGELAINSFPDAVKRIPNPLSWVIHDNWTGNMEKCGGQQCRLDFSLAFGLLIYVFAAISVFFACFAIALAFLTFASRPDWVSHGKLLRIASIVGVLAFAVLCGGAIVLLWDARGRLSAWDPLTIALALLATIGIVVSAFLVYATQVDSNYFWRRRFETQSGSSLVYAILALAVGSVPLVPFYLFNYGGSFSGGLSAVLGALGGLASALYGHLMQSERRSSGGPAAVLATIASATFLYFMLIVAYLLAHLLFHTDQMIQIPAVTERWIQGLIVFAMVLALMLGWLSNLNHVGLHRFYRDRIMEAFMPEFETVRARDMRTVPSPDADNLQISDLWPTPPGQYRPYPLINTNVVLVNDPSPKYSSRGGDNFVVSPFYVGSEATGWEDTSRYIKQNGSFTLASAMAASGAALNANAAYAGAGITRDRLLSIVMMTLNFRLGLWVASPSPRKHRYRLFTPNHFHPGLTFGIMRRGYTGTSSFSELTDGGHFDNLGLYELVRRRCAIIVAIDAEADPDTTMPGLVSVAQRVEEDFGARIDLPPATIDGLIPASGSGFPEGAKYVRSPFFVTTIHYAPVKDEPKRTHEPDAGEQDKSFAEAEAALKRKQGTLVYVKAGLVAELDFATKGYWAQNQTFPHQNTSDQFFEPTQFDAYRQLGYCTMQQAIEGSILTD